MRLGYFTMPVHPLGRDWSQTLREDREAFILADKLGFYDCFMGEHLTDACENVTNWSASGTGSRLRRMALTKENIAVLAPIPSASEMIATDAKVGLRRNPRSASLTSRITAYGVRALGSHVPRSR